MYIHLTMALYMVILFNLEFLENLVSKCLRYYMYNDVYNRLRKINTWYYISRPRRSSIHSEILNFFLQIFNSLIIYKLKQHQKSLPDKQRDKRKQLRDRQLIFMLLLVTFVLLTLTSPLYLRLVVYLATDKLESPKRFAGYYGFVQISNKMVFFNSAINFYLYCLSGTKFRNDTLKIIRSTFCCLNKILPIESIQESQNSECNSTK